MTSENGTKPEVGRQLQNLLLNDTGNAATNSSNDVATTNGNTLTPAQLPLHSSGMPLCKTVSFNKKMKRN